MRAFILLLAALLSSCIYPVRPWKDDSELAAKGANRALTPHDLETSRALVSGLHLVLIQAASDRHTADLVAGEVLFYGTFLTVLGVAIDSVGVRNTGGGIAALASIFSGHYKLSDQRAVFSKAEARAACVEEAIRPISPAVRELFSSKDFQADSDLHVKFYSVPDQTTDIVRKIGDDLDVALNGISLAAPTKEEMTTTLQNWTKEKTDASAGEDKKANNPEAVNTALMRALNMDEKSFSARSAAGPCATSISSVSDEKTLALCRLMLLTDAEREDAKHAFAVATKAYAATLSACMVQNAQ